MNLLPARRSPIRLTAAPNADRLSVGTKLHRPRGATWTIFFVSGAVIGTWAASIPAVRARLDISTGTISLCVFVMGLGTVLTGMLIGQLLDQRLTVQAIRVGAVIVPIAGVFALVAPSLLTLVLALGALGATFGLLDVTVNAHGAAIERSGGRAIMSSLHGGWSIGGLVGAGIVALTHLAGVDSRLGPSAFLACLVLVGVWFGVHLGDSDSRHLHGVDRPPEERVRIPPRGVLLIGLLALLIFAAEGTVTDWSSLYVVEELGGSSSVGAIGIAGLSGGMAIGRLVGDPMNRRLGPRRLLQLGGLLTAGALLAMLVLSRPAVAVPALILVGIGLANGAPLLLSAAAASGGISAGAAIAATSSMGNLGMLIISPLLGIVAQLSSLTVTLATAACLAAAMALGCGRAFGEGQ